MANENIRAAAAVAGVKLWQIAARLGLNDSQFSRRLRFELPDVEKRKILSIIDELKTAADVKI